MEPSEKTVLETTGSAELEHVPSNPLDDGASFGFTAEVSREDHEKGFEAQQQQERIKIPLEEYASRAQQFLDQYERSGFFATYAKDISLKFHVGDAFMIDYESGTVHLDGNWFHERNFTNDQILWACLHELSHFIDLTGDPKGMEEQHESLKERAKKKAELFSARLSDIIDLSDPEVAAAFERISQPEGTQPDAVSQIEYHFFSIFHRFYNALDDVYVNNIVERRAPRFQRGREGGSEVTRLYNETLFPGSDYTAYSRHAQFDNTILRSHMLPDEEVTVSPEVEAALGKRFRVGDREYSVKDLMSAFYMPRTGKNTKVSERARVMKKTLDPVFEQLLDQDVEDWLNELKQTIEEKKKDQKKQEGKSEHGEKDEGDKSGLSGPKTGGEDEPGVPELLPFKYEGDKRAANSIDQISDDDTNEVVQRIIAKKNEPLPEPLTPEEVAAVFDAQQKKNWLDRAANSEDERARLAEGLKKMEQIEREIAPYLDELSEFWRGLSHGSTRGMDRARVGHFKTGDALDIPQVIRNYPEIAKGNVETTRNFERFEHSMTVVEKPEVMRVRIAGDTSSSMFEKMDERMRPIPEGKRKIESLKKALVLILRSLDEFSRYLEMNRSRLKINTAVESEAYMFGSGVQKVKSLHPESEVDQQKEIINSLIESGVPRGGTADYLCMHQIMEELTDLDKQLLEKKKILDMVIVITDGASNSPTTMKQYIDDMNALGMVVRGLQVGDASSYEQEAFEKTWGENGEILGEDLGRLLPAVVRLFREYFKEVKL